MRPLSLPSCAASALVASALIGAFACADAETSAAPEDAAADAPGSWFEAGDGDASALPGPCEAGDPTCTAESLPCSATDWCPVVSPADPRQALSALWGASAADVWAIGSGGGLLHWDGSGWSAVPSGTTYALNGIWGNAAGDVWVVSAANMILHSRGSAGWNRVAPIPALDAPGLLRSVWGPPEGGGLFVGGDWSSAGRKGGGSLWSMSSASGSWSAALGFGRFNVHGIWGSGADDVWIVGEPDPIESAVHSAVLHGGGGDRRWSESEVHSPSGFLAIWGASANDVWAVGRRGTIRHFDGQGWQIVSSPTTQDLYAVWGSGANDVRIAGDGGTLLRWDGNRWQSSTVSFPVGKNPNLYGIWGSGPGDVWAVGERGTILHSGGARP